ncbi:MAG: lysophospholipid acyltransferase family protein [Thermodesulfobacteriota bacterium]
MRGFYLLGMKAVAFVAGHIPLPLALALGRAMGALAWRLDAKHRRIALDNLDLAYGDSITRTEKEAIARGLFKGLGMLAFEFTRLPWLTREKLAGYVEMEGMERLTEALGRKKGVILVTAHLGNWELMAAWYGLMGYPVDVVVRRLDVPAVEDFVKWARTRCGNRIIFKAGSMRKLIRAVRRNQVVGILLDQNVADYEGVFVDYFGTPACTNKGPALLAAHTGAAVLPTFIVRRDGRHTIVIGEEIEMVNTGDKTSDVVENTARCTGVIERMVRRHPDHWFWVHRRWKTRPAAGGGGGGGGDDAKARD